YGCPLQRAGAQELNGEPEQGIGGYACRHVDGELVVGNRKTGDAGPFGCVMLLFPDREAALDPGEPNDMDQDRLQRAHGVRTLESGRSDLTKTCVAGRHPELRKTILASRELDDQRGVEDGSTQRNADHLESLVRRLAANVIEVERRDDLLDEGVEQRLTVAHVPVDRGRGDAELRRYVAHAQSGLAELADKTARRVQDPIARHALGDRARRPLAAHARLYTVVERNIDFLSASALGSCTPS